MDENTVALLYKTIYDGKGEKEAEKGVDRATSKVKNAGGIMSTAFSGATWAVFGKAIKKVTGYIAEASKASADYIETLNLLQVAYDGNTESIRRFASRLSDTLNLDDSTILKSAAHFKVLTQSMGIATETGEKLSKLLTKMTLDVSSLYNIDFDKAQTALQYAMEGRGTSLKQRTGVSVLETSVQTTLDVLGIDAYVEDMNDAEKAIARVISMEYQLMSSQGDLARTIEAPANQMRVMKEQITQLARNIGNVLLPVVAKILPYFNAILIVLNAIISALAKLVGYKEGMFDTFEDANTIDYFDGIGNAIDGVGKSAEKTAKKLQGLRGFDKLNVIKTPTESKDTGGSGVGTINPKLLGAFDSLADQYKMKLEGVKTKATEIAEKILTWLGFTKKVNEETGKIEWVFSRFTKGTLIAALGASGFIIVGLKKIYDFLKKIGLIKFGGITSAIKGITNVIKNGIPAIKAYKDGIVSLPTALSAISPKLGALTAGFKGLATAIGVSSGALAAIIASIVAIGAALVYAYNTDEDFKNSVNDMVSSVSQLFATLWQNIQTIMQSIYEVLAPIWNEIKDTVVFAVQIIYDTVTFVFKDIADIIGGVAKVITDLINGDYVKAFDDLGNIIGKLWDNWKKYFDKIKDHFKEWISKTIDNIKGFVSKMIEKLGDLLKWVGELPNKFFYFIGVAIGKLVGAIINTDWKELGDKILTGIVNGLINLWKLTTKASEWVTSTFEKLLNAIANIDWAALGKSILDGIINGMFAFGKKIKGWADSFVEGIKDGLGINSPSKLILDAKIGDFSMEAITLGMQRQLPLVEKEAQNIVDTLKDELTNQKIDTMIDYAMPDYNIGSSTLDTQSLKLQNAQASKSSFNPTFIVQVGNKELARQVITDLQDMAKDNGKPIMIGG